jgi:hypothetical protein
MGFTVRYLAVDGEDVLVANWFDQLHPPPDRIPLNRGEVLFFRDMGHLVWAEPRTIDTAVSPIVSLVSARRARGVLWTAGEVHFLPSSMRSRFPALEHVRRQFMRWLGRFDLVYDGKPGEWDYFLEGSIRNSGSRIYATPGAVTALNQGSYFVSDDDNDAVLDDLCRILALRGVTCDDRASIVSNHQ